MSNRKFFELLIIVICITVQSVAFDDNTINNKKSFTQQIKNLQDETNHLCSYIRETSLVTTKEFMRLMQNAHIDCPNLQELKVSLVNIEAQANAHRSGINQQLSTCDSIVYMLTKSLDNGDLVGYHLKEGNYSLVTDTINKWHQSFLNFKSGFHLQDIPLDIVLNSKKSFFYDDWITPLAKSALTLIAILVSSVVFLKAFTSIGLILWITNLFFSPATHSQQNQSILTRNSAKTEVVEPHLNAFNQHTHKSEQSNKAPYKGDSNILPNPNNSHLDNNDVEISSIPSKYNKFFANVAKVVWVVTVCGLIVITALCYPLMISFSTASRYNWYPAATAAIEKMTTHRDEVQSTVLRQIDSIEELQRYVNMYHDQTIQENTNILISNLATGIKHTSKELSDLYIASKQLPSTFRQAYTSIEAKAKKAGRLAEANNLLAALNETSEIYEKLQRSVQALMINQQEILPLLKEQTKIMHAHVQQGHLLDIHQIATEHTSTIMFIENYAYEVKVAIKDIITIVTDDNSDSDGMKKAIEELKDDIAESQYQAMAFGILGGIGGGVGSTILGTVALKSGYAIVSVTVTALAAPVAAATVGVGLLGLGAYGALTNYEKYNDASRYKTDLDILEAQRGNLHIAMKNLEEAINAQQEASKAAQTALNSIITHSASFSNIPGFVLPTEKRIALSNELLRIMQQYNTMTSIFESFKPYTADKHRERIAG